MSLIKVLPIQPSGFDFEPAVYPPPVEQGTKVIFKTVGADNLPFYTFDNNEQPIDLFDEAKPYTATPAGATYTIKSTVDAGAYILSSTSSPKETADTGKGMNGRLNVGSRGL